MAAFLWMIEETLDGESTTISILAAHTKPGGGGDPIFVRKVPRNTPFRRVRPHSRAPYDRGGDRGGGLVKSALPSEFRSSFTIFLSLAKNRERKISPKFFRPKFLHGRPRGMSVPRCLFFQDLEGLTEVFGGMSAGMSGRKLPLWAEFSFLKEGENFSRPTSKVH